MYSNNSQSRAMVRRSSDMGDENGEREQIYPGKRHKIGHGPIRKKKKVSKIEGNEADNDNIILRAY